MCRRPRGIFVGIYRDSPPQSSGGFVGLWWYHLELPSRGELMFKFKPYGPFQVPVDDGRVLTKELKEFWTEIDGQYPGLSGAVGCYIFAISSKKTKPWYVGK